MCEPVPNGVGDATTDGGTPHAATPRVDGYAPLRSYAAIGDGRCVALVADDGAVDWLAWPDLDSPSVFGALLDADLGGSFTLAPSVPFRTSRRYLPGTNVLETTFSAASGTVRVLDSLSLRGRRFGPSRELQRRVTGVTGEVPMGWRVRPRFDYGRRGTTLGWRSGVAVATSGADAMAVMTFGAGAPQILGGGVEGSFGTAPGSTATLVLSGAHQEPLVLPSRRELDERFDDTVALWKTWANDRRYDGPWHEQVLRSALALKLLVYAPSGAVAAAATTSLPEQVGGGRNWDYRFCWVRDAAFILSALLRLGCAPEAEAYFWWLMQATQLTQPRLQPLYRLDGGTRLPERALPLAGYLRSSPVRVGNAAGHQQQLDSYGELLLSAWLYAESGAHLDAEIGARLAAIADLVCELWPQRDAGIWEVRSPPEHFTHSKMMCWVGLDRAVRLADRGLVPHRNAERWRQEAAACEAFIETRCYSSVHASYARSAEGDELDASVLLGLLSGYGTPTSARWLSTVEAVRRELGHGPYVYRYTGEDGLGGEEGAFVSCSFWLVEALARTGRLDEATALMGSLLALANDVGLYAEEVDPGNGDFLGNLPQGLSHLALISAATALAQERTR